MWLLYSSFCICIKSDWFWFQADVWKLQGIWVIGCVGTNKVGTIQSVRNASSQRKIPNGHDWWRCFRHAAFLQSTFDATNLPPKIFRFISGVPWRKLKVFVNPFNSFLRVSLSAFIHRRRRILNSQIQLLIIDLLIINIAEFKVGHYDSP